MKNTRTMAAAALCVALCVVLPIAFHAVPNAGSILLPMHIPVLLCGLVCGWPYGLLCGLLGPVLSSMITGMPPAAILPVMTVELCVYGFVSGLMMQLLKDRKLIRKTYISMITAMILGRVAAGLFKGLIFAPGSLTAAAWAGAYFVTGLPGILMQLALVPALVLMLYKARILTLTAEMACAENENG